MQAPIFDLDFGLVFHVELLFHNRRNGTVDLSRQTLFCLLIWTENDLEVALLR